MILASTMLAQVLAQEDGTSYENIAYLVMFLILPLLNWLASKYKDWQTGGKDASDMSAGSDEEVIFDVSLDDDDEFVLRPANAERTASAAPAIPVAQPTLRPPTPPRPAAPRQPAPRQPTQRPPVARPVPTSRPATKPKAKRRSSVTSRASQSKRAVKKTKPRPVEAAATTEAKFNIAGIPVRSLRDAVILSEVLAPPLAIRQIDGRNSGFERPNL